MLSKRLKRTIKQRDSLDVLAANYQKDTTQRGVNYRKLKNELITCEKKYESLNKDHSELIASSLNTSDKLNKALEQKQKDLEEKEKLLREREKNLRELKAIIARQDSVADALNQLVKKALLGFNSDEFTTEIKNGKVYVSLANKLLFQSGKAEIEDKGKDALKKLAQALSKNNDINLDVEGHTDNVPIKTAQFRDNWDLSVARALNVLKVLESEQVPSNRLTASGKGEYSPKADNATAEGRALNRRTEIILSPKLDMLFQMFELNKK
ncbi:MAG: OmpA family protein [Bacteroidia bacterium]|nr:OmpA family protein [Bacteroidia bacterium]